MCDWVERLAVATAKQQHPLSRLERIEAKGTTILVVKLSVEVDPHHNRRFPKKPQLL